MWLQKLLVPKLFVFDVSLFKCFLQFKLLKKSWSLNTKNFFCFCSNQFTFFDPNNFQTIFEKWEVVLEKSQVRTKLNSKIPKKYLLLKIASRCWNFFFDITLFFSSDAFGRILRMFAKLCLNCVKRQILIKTNQTSLIQSLLQKTYSIIRERKNERTDLFFTFRLYSVSACNIFYVPHPHFQIFTRYLAIHHVIISKK